MFLSNEVVPLRGGESAFPALTSIRPHCCVDLRPSVPRGGARGRRERCVRSAPSSSEPSSSEPPSSKVPTAASQPPDSLTATGSITPGSCRPAGHRPLTFTLPLTGTKEDKLGRVRGHTFPPHTPRGLAVLSGQWSLSSHLPRRRLVPPPAFTATPRCPVYNTTSYLL